MIQELFHIGPLSISPFGVMMVLAFGCAWAQLRWGMKRLDAGDDDDASALVLAAGVGGILGAKLYYAALVADWRALLSRSGLVWYGGLIGGTLAVLWLVRRRRLHLGSIADAMAPSVAIGYAIGRIGCFLVGDDYGMPTRLPWGVAFPVGLPGPTTAGFMRSEYGAEIPAEIAASELVAVHPTQLYETLAGVALWLVGIRMLRRRAEPGNAALWIFGLLGVERFLVEFLRAKDDRLLDTWTLAQLFSALLVLLVVTLLVRRFRRPPPLDFSTRDPRGGR